MNKYELLSHTADIRIRATGDTLEELFSALLEGICEIADSNYKNYLNKNFNIHKEIHVESFDSTTHAIDFLSEVLSMMNIEKAIFTRVEFNEISTNSSYSIIHGWKTDGFQKDIKAITYHDAELINLPDGKLSITVLLDI